MPKKHRNSFAYTKPAGTAHHSLTSSAGPSGAAHNAHHARVGTGPARGPERSMGRSSIDDNDSSVNDLINHLRRTQGLGSHEGSASSPRLFGPQRSLPPALRSVLQLPEHPAPRPRRNIFHTRINGRPRRPPPGPAAPASWSSETRTNRHTVSKNSNMEPWFKDQIVYRLNRLPGRFPTPTSLQHLAYLRTAMDWTWYVEELGEFLAETPSHLKQMLLSYIAFYWRPANSANVMNGLRPLYLSLADYDRLARAHPGHRFQGMQLNDSRTVRLDLSKAIGYWLTMREVIRALQLPSSSSHTPGPSTENNVPESWDETEAGTEAGSVPRPIQGRLFPSLRYLSLAHPKIGSVSWNELVSLTSHLPTLTHLSLAHWPALRTECDPNLRDDHAAILRQIARNTYCLEWLDLEGCTSWIEALAPGLDPAGNPTGVGSDGPDWNGPWRNVEHLILSPGYWVQLPPEESIGTSTRSMEAQRRGKWEEAWEDAAEFNSDVHTAKKVADAIKARRKKSGKTIVVETGEREAPDIYAIMRECVWEPLGP
ncbi:hypothetical protein N7493_005528 [Penicillium malachiteum]|uniref:Uncharacterized protein n=1 Tax=Penicillium malachiteum TaxID=1324776 RepID=A0AAD6MWL5_9EURO|nr:hypothetical protein N7493_005528 [Penicillium malachiteum]